MLDVFTLLGGLGLFLIGMQVLTDGLRSLAGESLRRLLVRFTRSPVSGAATGAISTAIIQSSSATTVAAVGFVGAGLLSFQQALGVIFGANLGTTMTGWIVALVGFKLDIALFVFPLAFVGAMLKLFATDKLQQVGWSIAGFSLVFIGIDALQTGMSSYQDLVTPTTFPSDTFLGRLQLVGIGIIITVVTQSSSAGVATALVALNVGAISFNQAAAMVIGMDVGTTFTAALAALGGSTAMRRTGYAHVIYNVLTGIMALALLTPFTAIISHWLAFDRAGDAQIALVAFHSTFNLIGVLVVIGFTGRFAGLITRLVPGKVDDVLAALDDRLLRDGVAATDVATGSTERVAASFLAEIAASMRPQTRARAKPGSVFAPVLETLSDYTMRIHAPHGSLVNRRVQSLIHAQDHLIRLCRRYEALNRHGLVDERLSDQIEALADVLADAATQGFDADFIDRTNRLRKTFRADRERLRQGAFADLADGTAGPESALAAARDMRWLHRSAYHAWRIGFHLHNAKSDWPIALVASEERRIDEEEGAD